MTEFDFECAVIGGGPAGSVAALYLGRYRRQTVQISSGIPRINWVPRTHNLLGYRGGITGRELRRRLQEQVLEVGVEQVEAQMRVDPLPAGGFFLRGVELELKARKVIIATGIQDLQPPITNLVDLRKLGLFRYCPICDAYDFRDKEMAVLAQDDHGLQTALFLSRFGSRVHVIMAREPVPSPAVVEKCRAAGVHFIRGRIERVDVLENHEGVRIHVEEAHPLTVHVCYVALGLVVNDYAFTHLRPLTRAEDGRLKVGEKQSLSVPGLYAAGDCVDSLAQISVAAGQAAVAATAVHNELRRI
jgi:thioredoxin reductase (NADPH)